MSKNPLSAAIAKTRERLEKEAKRERENYEMAEEIVDDLKGFLCSDNECALAILVTNDGDGFKIAKRSTPNQPFATINPVQGGKVEIKTASDTLTFSIEDDDEKAFAALANLLIATGAIPRKAS